MVDRGEPHDPELALVKCRGNGSPFRECVHASLSKRLDQIRYFAAALRANSGKSSDIDATTIDPGLHEPDGVAGRLIPWNAPRLMALMKLRPA